MLLVKLNLQLNIFTVTIFELNEKIKEELVMDYGAWEAKSIFFKDGVKIIPEPFLETTIRWDKDIDSNLLGNAINKILEFRDSLGDRCFMTDVQYETSYGHPQVIWGIFKENEDIFTN